MQRDLLILIIFHWRKFSLSCNLQSTESHTHFPGLYFLIPILSNWLRSDPSNLSFTDSTKGVIQLDISTMYYNSRTLEKNIHKIYTRNHDSFSLIFRFFNNKITIKKVKKKNHKKLDCLYILAQVFRISFSEFVLVWRDCLELVVPGSHW